MSGEDWKSGRYSYREAENERYKVYVSGVIFIEKQSNLDLLLLADKIVTSNIDYNMVHGWYRIAIYSKQNDSWLFFGDAVGSQRFFFDNKAFSDSFLALRRCYGNSAEPNYTAISELLKFGKMLDNGTIIKGIKQTNPDCYYLLQRSRGGVESVLEYSKKLSRFSDMQKDLSLDDIMAPLLRGKVVSSLGAVCTGGTDSRAVIANLTFHGCKPELVITGHIENPDILVAKTIAKTLNLTLKIIDPTEKETEWLDYSFYFLDGQYDVVLGYRQLTKALWAKNENISFEFGGVAGEFYKNAFCHPIRNGLFKKCDKKYLYRALFAPSMEIEKQEWYGDKLKEFSTEVKDHIEYIISNALQEKNLLAKCNRVGYEFLRNGSGAITHGYSSAVCKIDPLLDRSLVASVSYKNPSTLAMNVWQRRQIFEYNANLCDISTDQGYSCTLKFLPLVKEIVKKELFYLSRIKARIQKRLGLPYKSGDSEYWNSDYRDAQNTEQFQHAVQYCIKNGILKCDKVPLSKVGNVLLIGMMFDNNRWKCD